MMHTANIYTDGSCLNHLAENIGGWAYIVKQNDTQKINSGATQFTTSMRMEWTAIINAIKSLKKPCNITLYSDAQEIVKTINQLIHQESKKRIKKKNDKDLLKKYLKVAKNHKIKAIWVRAHGTCKLNRQCDILARKTAREFKKKLNNNAITV